MKRIICVLTCALLWISHCGCAGEHIYKNPTYWLFQKDHWTLRQIEEYPVPRWYKKDFGVSIRRNELMLLAKCAYAEANGQSDHGVRLVVDVILNRVRSERFPDTIEAVITQADQFETWSNGMIETAPVTERIVNICREELRSRKDDEILFFTAGYYNPYCVPAYVYEDHYFGY